jgi:hypothetical protein
MRAPYPGSPEPATIVAGDTLAWTKTVTLYSGTLTYSLQLPGSTAAPITFTAAGGGPTYFISVPDSTTATWPPGNYLWTAYVDDGVQRHVVDSGALVILANPAAALGGTHASRTLAIIEAAIEGRLPRGLENYVIDGQSIGKIAIVDLIRMRSIYADWVRNENAQDRVNRGLANPRNAFARFTRSPRGYFWR